MRWQVLGDCHAAALDGFGGPPPSRAQGYAGIDPGLDGYIAVICPTRGIETYKTPTYTVRKKVPKTKKNKRGYKDQRFYDLPKLWRIVCGLRGRVVRALIEQQQVYPDQGAVSNFTTGHGYGIWLMALNAASIPYLEMRAGDWKKHAGILLPKSAPQPGLDEKARKRIRNERRKQSKDIARSAAERMFPGFSFLRTPRCKISDDNMCEAVLMAELMGRLRDAA